MSEIVRRCIRSTGREFEEGFACEGDLNLAYTAALAFWQGLPHTASPALWRSGQHEFAVRWWSAD